MGSQGYHEGTQIDKYDGSGGIRIAHAEVDTGEFQSKQQPRYETMEKHDIGMK